MIKIQLHRFNQLLFFEEALTLQQKLVESCRVEGKNHLMLLQHHPVYTAGRRSVGFARNHGPHLLHHTKIPAIDVSTDRGGQITFHGPGQWILYPILDLRQFQPSLKWYVQQLEQVMIDCCISFGITQVVAKEGVWVEGFRNSGWIVSHGLSLNVCLDIHPFRHIIPCGDPNMEITSIHGELPSANPQDLLQLASVKLLESFSKVFAVQLL